MIYLPGGKLTNLPQMDGISIWKSISENSESPRNLMLHNIDDTRHIASVRVGDWKLMKGKLNPSLTFFHMGIR